jgi:S-adenosylmethionine:tRNA ribosyltransferase-isomerase
LNAKDISIKDYDYELPEERIARYPLADRDASKLLLYKGGKIQHTVFKNIHQELPPSSLLVFNNTRVIHARMYFELPNGSRLEILCLEPLSPSEYQLSFSSTQPVRWKCLIGGNRKWKQGVITKSILVGERKLTLTATRVDRLEDSFEVRFEWDDPSVAFGELLASAGIIPLPPYLNREAEASDEGRYQTVYAKVQGSVAAPTAGLHFTEEVIKQLEQNGVQRLFTTLHVGAGTFKPVKAESLAGHHMHEESIYIRKEQLEQLHQALEADQAVIPVGTTSMRLLESLYWHGLQIRSGQAQEQVNVAQWYPYEAHPAVSPAAAIASILTDMEERGKPILEGQTQIIIAPAYKFRICRGIITNFHQPRSTLLLLISALVGNDWKKIYEYAMANDFRFLSYGDSSLLLP